MNFLAPAALAFAALSIPLVVLYMLRTRRHRHEVSSVMLWDRAGVAVTSAVPWQRPRMSALFLLQLLVLLLFALLLARPFGREVSLLGPHTVFVMDTSGSMAMEDRLESAKDRALDLIGAASGTNAISIIDAGPRPRVLAALVREPAELRGTISDLTVGGGQADLAGAISLANSLATPDRPTRILIFSDGGSPDVGAPVEPVIGAEHLLFADSRDNAAITAFSGEATSDGQVRLFVEVTNYGTQPLDALLSFSVDGGTPVSLPASLTPGGRFRDGLRVDAGSGSSIAVTLQGQDGSPLVDGNPLDDASFMVLGVGDSSGVAIVGTGSIFLDALIDSVAGFDPAAGEAPEVLIIDRETVANVTAPTWLIRPATPPDGVTITGVVQNTAATFQRPGEPLLADVDLSQLAIGEADIVDAPDWLPLVKAGDVPLVLLGEVDGHRSVYFTFDLTQSNLPVQVGFPIFGTHILQYLAGQDLASLVPGPAGQPITVAPPPGFATTVITPSGETRNVPATVGRFEDTVEPGIYHVVYEAEGEEARTGPVAVRLFSTAESVGSSRQIQTESLALAPADATAIVREWAPWIVSIVLALMLIEWWLGHGAPRPAWLRRSVGGGAA